MNDVATLLLCLAPATVLVLLLAGTEKLFEILVQHCEPVRRWQERGIKRMEEYQEDED